MSEEISALFWVVGALLIVGGIVGGWLHIAGLTIQAIRQWKNGEGGDDDWGGAV